MKTHLKLTILLVSILNIHCGGSKSSGRANTPSSTVCSAPSTTGFQSGSGTPSDPYLICSALQLLLINTNSTYLSSSYKLATDLDLSAITTFTPIGARDNASPGSAVPFTGNFDGDGHTISGLSYQATNTTLSAGLFGFAQGSTIENLNITSSEIKGAYNTGLLVGYGENLNLRNISLQGRVAPRDAEIVNIRCAGLVGQLVVTQSNTPFVVEDIDLNVELVANDACGSVYGWMTLLTNDTQLTVRNIQNTVNYTQSSDGNSMGSVGGYVDLNATNVTLNLSNIRSVGNFSMPVSGGSFSGGLFGQFQVRGTNVLVTVENTSMQGNFSARSTFNLAGSIGGVAGNISLSATNSTMRFNRVSMDGEVRVLASSVTNNNSIAGFIGQLSTNNNTTSQFIIENSYFNGALAHENTNTLNNVSGFIGHFSGGTTGSANLVIRTSYANFTASLSASSVTNRLAVVGRHSNVVTSDFLDVYYQSPAAFIGGSGQAEPSNDPEVVSLNTTQILQSSSFVGAGWDFSTIWSANNGVRPPTLR